MKPLLPAFILCASLIGCQTCDWTESYCDHIDVENDLHPTCGDDLYHPSLDLTRIGRRDWCQTRMGGLFRRACRAHPPYPQEVYQYPDYGLAASVVQPERHATGDYDPAAPDDGLPPAPAPLLEP